MGGYKGRSRRVGRARPAAADAVPTFGQSYSGYPGFATAPPQTPYLSGMPAAPVPQMYPQQPQPQSLHQAPTAYSQRPQPQVQQSYQPPATLTGYGPQHFPLPGVPEHQPMQIYAQVAAPHHSREQADQPTMQQGGTSCGSPNSQVPLHLVHKTILLPRSLARVNLADAGEVYIPDPETMSITIQYDEDGTLFEARVPDMSARSLLEQLVGNGLGGRRVSRSYLTIRDKNDSGGLVRKLEGDEWLFDALGGSEDLVVVVNEPDGFLSRFRAPKRMASSRSEGESSV